ncbi:unnamed protein product, partial [Brenthis ino]
MQKKTLENTQQSASAPNNLNKPKCCQHYAYQEPEKDIAMPPSVLTKSMRTLATKKREFIKLKKNVIAQQNTLLEYYAAIKDLESRTGSADECLGEIRVVSVKGWPAHDLLLLVRNDIKMPMSSEISGIFGPQVLQQIQAQLNPIPEEVIRMGAEIMARRIELINLLRCKHRTDRSTFHTNSEWKTKNIELDNETEQLHRMVAGIAENLKSKINYSLDLAKIPWIDRETAKKKMERIQKENALLQHKIEETSAPSYQSVCDELVKEKAARESLKEVVSTAESMLRVARARIVTLERQLKDTKVDLESVRRKYADLEQLYRHRESSYDARSKKLIEVSKTGEITIEALSRQRDALEARVKELREQAEIAEQAAQEREAAEKAHVEILQAKEKNKRATEERVAELEGRIRELEEQLSSLRERSVRLVDMERRRCLEFIPTKENEPSDRETEIWKELQVTRVALSRAEEELRRSHADKDSFLNSLSKIAQEEGADKEDKMAAELLNREQKIMQLQHVIEEQRENEKTMEQSMTEYENQLATLRLEVMRLKNYECYSKELPYQDVQTELLEMHMQVETLTRERSALVSAAASRALMLERHERAADLFARVIRARRDLAAHIEERAEPPSFDSNVYTEVSRSLTSVCASAADTWSALRAERARVLRLESVVLAQSLQLERESRVRTQLERRRAVLEREILRTRHTTSSHKSSKNPNSSIFWNE